jgi:prohibitin 2
MSFFSGVAISPNGGHLGLAVSSFLESKLFSSVLITNQTVVQSQAAARSNVAKANGESQAIRIITSQLKQSPEYLQWLSINRWNGQLPYALSGAVPFFQLPSITTQQTQSNSSSTFAGGH